MAKKCIVFYIDDLNDYDEQKAVFEYSLSGFEKAKKYVTNIMHDRESQEHWENFTWSRETFEKFLRCGFTSLSDGEDVYYCLQQCNFFFDTKLEIE